MQPPTFKGEGKDVERNIEVGLEAIEDYFVAAKTFATNKAMMGIFCLSGNVKLWRK